MRRFKIAFFFETPFYLCVLHIYHVTRVATLSVRILVFSSSFFNANTEFVSIYIGRYSFHHLYNPSFQPQRCKTLKEVSRSIFTFGDYIRIFW